jgi:hypothetical protein
MGSIPFPGGFTFRVWAPFATAVTVAGEFNGWSEQATPLASEGNGYWSTDVGGAQRGHEYKYVLRTPSGDRWRNDPYARDVTHSAGNSIVYSDAFDWGPSGFRMPPWDELVIYELHVGTFNDAPGGAPGGFQSVAARLDYLRNLGINAVELMPSAEFATDFSWGYNPAHIFTIESAFGGPDALKTLIRAAHERGIAVIVDVVYNHLGPDDLDLWQFDGWNENGKGGIYFYNDDRRSQTPWAHTRPDYGRPEVVAFLRDNAGMWLEEFRVDGLRWDATGYIRNIYGGNDMSNDIPDGWRLMQTAAAVEAQHRRGPAGRRRNHPAARRGRRGLRQPMGRRLRPSGPRGAHCLQRRGPQHAAPALGRGARRRVRPAAGDLHRVPRRGGQRQGSAPERDLAGQRGQLVLTEALHARGGARVHRPRDTDDLPGAGAPGRHLVPRPEPDRLD